MLNKRELEDDSRWLIDRRRMIRYTSGGVITALINILPKRVVHTLIKMLGKTLRLSILLRDQITNTAIDKLRHDHVMNVPEARQRP
jgi:hypothetical protein